MAVAAAVAAAVAVKSNKNRFHELSEGKHAVFPTNKQAKSALSGKLVLSQMYFSNNDLINIVYLCLLPLLWLLLIWC